MQRSTEDAGMYLTHLVKAGWTVGLMTSVVAFDIAQFFPSINHDFLIKVMEKFGFPECLVAFFRSYLVGRKTRYAWNDFISEPFEASVGVGQGSALSPPPLGTLHGSDHVVILPGSPWGRYHADIVRG